MAEISETIVKDQRQQAGTPLPGNSGKQKIHQRYALRSGTKPKEDKELVAEMANSSSSTITAASKRSRPLSSVSKSVGVLDLSGKDKSAAKPPRRLSSIPPKSNASPAPKLAGNITPTSEARAMRSGSSQNRNESSPFSEFSRSTSRKKLDILSYASYWISQIKLSETAAKHSISLGFFKLALESGCKPLQRLREELKSYASRHDLTENGESMKQLLESYGISEMAGQLQVSENYFQVPEEATRSSDDEVHSFSSTVETKKLKAKSLNTDAAAVNTTTQVSPVTESNKKRANQRNGNNNNNTNSAAKVRGPWNKNPVAKSPAVETTTQKAVKKPHKPSKVESNKDKEKTNKKQRKESICAKVPISYSPQDALQSNKENLDVSEVEEITAEVM